MVVVVVVVVVVVLCLGLRNFDCVHFSRGLEEK